MIKKLLFIIFLSVTFLSCKKSSDSTGCPYTESTLVAPASEIADVQTFINTYHPAAIQHPSGLFYEILAPGAGASPTVCSTITVRYSGYLTSGVKFDENLSGATFIMGQLIVGWQKGLALIKKGGSMNLYVPPSLGYGSHQVGSVPANSILIFVITLDNV
jgi:FKBP-type peptidyl-prolyl cis-trans isomerase FkpA